MNMERINFYLPEQQISTLRDMSKLTGISVSEHIRRAISAYLSMVCREWAEKDDGAGLKETAYDEYEIASMGYEVGREEGADDD